AAALPPLGRAGLPLLVLEDPPSLESWRQDVEAARADFSVAVLSPAAPGEVRELARQAGCLRAALLDHFGEPVAVPCGRCSGCQGTGLEAFEAALLG
ncbi:MAG TPA: RecQ family zinc-binding domain-containing protein, partial [Sporichthya sp.]|nr:RecQ family zinc-binding domain-containing protein [Sporichthya sp.]